MKPYNRRSGRWDLQEEILLNLVFLFHEIVAGLDLLKVVHRTAVEIAPLSYGESSSNDCNDQKSIE